MAFIAGKALTAGQLNDTYPLFAYKTADETVTNSTTLQADNHLFLPIAANTTYVLEASIGTLSPTAADGKLLWTYPSGCLLDWGQHNVTTTATSNHDQGDWNYRRNAGTQSTTLFWGGVGSNVWVSIDGLLRVGNSSGTLQLWWAQLTANASATFVSQGSWLLLTKVS